MVPAGVLSPDILSIVQVTARRGRAGELAAAMQARLGLALPAPGHAAHVRDICAFQVQPEGWLVVARGRAEGVLARDLDAVAEGLAAVVDQSHGRGMVRVTGADVRFVLGKVCRLDLHPRVFPAGRAAVTAVAELACVLHHGGDGAFEIFFPASYRGSLVHALEAAARGSGCLVG